MNLPTVIVLLAVLVLVVVDIIALKRGKGRCKCDGSPTKGKPCSSCASCSTNCPLKGK